MQQAIVRERTLSAQAIALLVTFLVALGVTPALGVQQAWADSPTITLKAEGQGTCELVGVPSSLNTTPWSATYDNCVKLTPDASGKVDVSGYSHVVLIAKSGTVSQASWEPSMSNGSDWATNKSWMHTTLQNAGAYGYLENVSSEAAADRGLTLTVTMEGGSSEGGTTETGNAYALSFDMTSPGSSAIWEKKSGDTVSAQGTSLSYTINGTTPAQGADGELSYQLMYKAESASEWSALGEAQAAQRNEYNQNKYKMQQVGATVPQDVAAGTYDVKLTAIWKINGETVTADSPYSWKMTVSASQAKYSITKTEPVNGKLFVGGSPSQDTVTEAAEGDAVEFYVEPGEGFEVDAVSVKDADGNDVEWSIPNADYSRYYKFTMPAKAVTISATFKAAGSSDPAKKIDVPTGETNLVYTGSEQTGVKDGEGYTLTGNKATDAGNYTATATLAEGYVWNDGTDAAKTIEWSIAKLEIAAPTAEANLVASGSEQTGVKDGEGYTLTGNKATEAGDYTATATADKNHVFAEGKTEVSIAWTIAAATTGSNTGDNTGDNTGKTEDKTDPSKTEDKTDTNKTDTNKNADTKNNTNNTSNTNNNNTKAGATTNAGSGTPLAASGAKTNTQDKASTTSAKTTTAKKAKKANTMTVKAKTATVKASKVKKKAQTLKVGKVLTVKKAKGKLTYAKKSGNKKITINKKTGKVTVKKGLKKGTYKVKVQVKAAGNASFKAKTKTVTFKVKVK